MSFQAYLDNIEAKTGLTPRRFVELAAEKGVFSLYDRAILDRPNLASLDPETRETFQPRLWLIVGGLALLMAYVVAFIAQNNKSVTVHFVLVSAKTSVIWLILLSLAIGLIGGVLLSQLERRRGRKQRN